jgi:hypothetical protein
MTKTKKRWVPCVSKTVKECEVKNKKLREDINNTFKKHFEGENDENNEQNIVDIIKV